MKQQKIILVNGYYKQTNSHFMPHITKPDYKQLESKVDKSISNEERIYIGGYDMIYFYDKPKGTSFSLDF